MYNPEWEEAGKLMLEKIKAEEAMKTITNGSALDISRWLGKRVRAHSKLDGKIVEGVLCEEAEGVEGFFVLTNTWYMVGINQRQRIDLLDGDPMSNTTTNSTAAKRTIREIADATDEIRQCLPWLSGVGRKAMPEDKQETYFRLLRRIESAVMGLEALAAPPDPWTHMPKDGWTAETLPEHGRFIAWIYANKIHVGKNRGGLFTADTYEVRADNVVWWRYIDAPTALDGAARDGE